MNYSIIVKLISFILMALTAAFGISAVVDYNLGSSETLTPWLKCIAISLSLAGALYMLGKKKDKNFFRKEAMAVIGRLCSSLVCHGRLAGTFFRNPSGSLPEPFQNPSGKSWVEFLLDLQSARPNRGPTKRISL